MILITELKNFILVDVRGCLGLLVVSVEITAGIVVRVVLPVTVLHHLTLSQVGAPLDELGKPAEKDTGVTLLSEVLREDILHLNY